MSQDEKQHIVGAAYWLREADIPKDARIGDMIRVFVPVLKIGDPLVMYDFYIIELLDPEPVGRYQGRASHHALIS